MKKIVLTENQLKNIVKVVTEQEFDDTITTYNREKNEKISLGHNDAKMLLSLSKNWCRDKENHPDCEEVLRIQSNLNLY